MDKSLIDRVNHFGFRLLAELNKDQHDQNLFFSPASITLALMLVWSGAKEETRKAIGKTLGLSDLDQNDLDALVKQLQQELGESIEGVQLNIANSLWLDQKPGMEISPDFLRLCQQNYDVELRSLTEGVDAINAWVSDKTNGMINQMVGSIDPLTVLIVLNAIYFKGTWTNTFEESLTIDDDFHVSGDETIQTPMMNMTEVFNYTETDEVQSISLPYGDARTSMYVLLPKKHTELGKVVETTRSMSWCEEFTSQFTSQDVTLKLPIFGIEYELELKNLLSSLGMGIAFDKIQADFTGMVSQLPEGHNVYISSIKHKAFVKVNEEGTEAAAVTAIMEDEYLSDGPSKTISMIINRPCLYFIRDNQTGLVLFLGTMINPSLGMDPNEIRTVGTGELSPGLPAKLLIQLAQDQNASVRQQVAKHLFTPVEVLTRLAEDHDAYVRAGVAGNPITPEKVLIQLAQDQNSQVHYSLVNNPRAPDEILIQLAQVQDSLVRYSIANNPRAQVEVLIQLAQDDDASVRQSVAYNRNTPAEALIQLAQDQNKTVRDMVANNPNTPADVLSQLDEDNELSTDKNNAKNE